jgi:OOP family OmpA-OmpF porin
MDLLRSLRLAAVAAVFPMAVTAQSAGTVEVGLFARHNLYGDTLRLAPAPGLGARVGVFLLPSLALEGDIAWARPGVRNLPDTATLRSVTHPLLSARLTYHQRIDDRARLLLGLGYALDAYTGDRTVAPQGAGPSALVGLRFRLTDRLSARAEGTGTWVMQRENVPVAVPAHLNLGAQAGVSLQLFGGRTRAVPVRTDTIRVVERDTVYITRIDTVYIKGPAGRPVVVGSVHFALNIQELSPEAKKILDLIAESLLDPVNLTRTVAVTGNTDGIGSERYNLRLGQQRADRTKAYLVSKGIAAERIQARTQGESDPVAPNRTADGRASNRRVLIILTN